MGTTETSGTTCQCRRDMRWNTKAFECQLFIDVDCKNVTYSSTVSDQVKAAAETLESTVGNATIEIPTNRTQTGEESLKESLLSVITSSANTTLEVLNEAFLGMLRPSVRLFRLTTQSTDRTTANQSTTTSVQFSMTAQHALRAPGSCQYTQRPIND